VKICPTRFKNSSPTKVSRAISPHHSSHGKMVWVKQASSRCSYWRELRWQSLAWLEGIGSLPSTMERIAEMSPSNIVLVRRHMRDYMVKKDVSKFKPFGCKAYVHLTKERREKGKHTPRAVDLGFASDCNFSAYKFYIPSSGKCIVSNQARFDEESFPYRNQDMIRGKLDEDNKIENLSVDKLPTRWIDFTQEINLDQYEKFMLEMENITFYDPKQSRMCT
jgi:hypothetical protein